MSPFVAAISAWVAVGLTLGAFAYWMRLIRRVEVARGRFVVNAATGAAVALALAALGAGEGFATTAPAVASLLAGALYFGLLAVAGQSNQRPAVAVGDRLLDFTAPDHAGRAFALSSLAGRPVLLKFFRGHW